MRVWTLLLFDLRWDQPFPSQKPFVEHEGIKVYISVADQAVDKLGVPHEVVEAHEADVMRGADQDRLSGEGEAFVATHASNSVSLFPLAISFYALWCSGLY